MLAWQLVILAPSSNLNSTEQLRDLTFSLSSTSLHWWYCALPGSSFNRRHLSAFAYTFFNRSRKRTHRSSPLCTISLSPRSPWVTSLPPGSIWAISPDTVRIK